MMFDKVMTSWSKLVHLYDADHRDDNNPDELVDDTQRFVHSVRGLLYLADLEDSIFS